MIFLFFKKSITPPIIIDNYGFLNNKAKPWQKNVQYDKEQSSPKTCW
jgi:hypothetical protein